MLDERVSKLVDSIYDAPHDAGAWKQVALDIRSALDCRALLVSTVDAKNHSLSSTTWYGADDTQFAIGVGEYSDVLYRSDPTISYAARFPAAGVCDVRQLLTPEALAREPFMKWYRQRFKSPYFVVGYTPPDDGLTFGLSMHPGNLRKGLANSEERLFQLLFSHMARSVAIAARPPSLEGHADALLFARPSGQIVALTSKAEEYVRSGDGLSFEAGHLRASTLSDANALDRAIHLASMPAVTGSAGTVLIVRRPSQRRSWLISITPLSTLATPASAFQARVLIKIVDPSRHRSLGHEVCEQFGLTAREREVADLLLAGHSPASAAELLKMSVSTARVHLQTLFRKTGTSRQADLMRLLVEIS